MGSPSIRPELASQSPGLDVSRCRPHRLTLRSWMTRPGADRAEPVPVGSGPQIRAHYTVPVARLVVQMWAFRGPLRLNHRQTPPLLEVLSASSLLGREIQLVTSFHERRRKHRCLSKPELCVGESGRISARRRTGSPPRGSTSVLLSELPPQVRSNLSLLVRRTSRRSSTASRAQDGWPPAARRSRRRPLTACWRLRRG